MQEHVEVIPSHKDVEVENHIQFSRLRIDISQHFFGACAWKLTDKDDILTKLV